MTQEEIGKWNEAFEKTINRYGGYFKIKDIDDLLVEWDKNCRRDECYCCRLSNRCRYCVLYKYNHNDYCYNHLGYQLLKAFHRGDFCTDDADSIVKMCLAIMIDELQGCRKWFNGEGKVVI